MTSIFLVFLITLCFLIGMTKFTNDTNYNEAVRYSLRMLSPFLYRKESNL